MTSILDTTVLVYAVGDRHDLREPAVALLQAVAAGAIRATTTPEAIQEFTHVRARRRGRTDATELAERYVDLLSPLLEITEDDLREGLALYRDADDLGSFDAVLAAAARRRGATLVSADKAFATVHGLRAVDLAAANVADLT